MKSISLALDLLLIKPQLLLAAEGRGTTEPGDQ